MCRISSAVVRGPQAFMKLPPRQRRSFVPASQVREMAAGAVRLIRGKTIRRLRRCVHGLAPAADRDHREHHDGGQERRCPDKHLRILSQAHAPRVYDRLDEGAARGFTDSRFCWLRGAPVLLPRPPRSSSIATSARFFPTNATPATGRMRASEKASCGSIRKQARKATSAATSRSCPETRHRANSSGA